MQLDHQNHYTKLLFPSTVPHIHEVRKKQIMVVLLYEN